MPNDSAYAIKYSPAADADTLRMYLLNGLQTLGLDKAYPDIASLDKDPLGVELLKAVKAWKTMHNAASKEQPMIVDGSIDWMKIVALQKDACAKKTMMSTTMTVGLAGLGFAALVGVGAYYMGKKSSGSQAELAMGESCGCWSGSSASRAQLAVGGWDSSINLPGYG